MPSRLFSRRSLLGTTAAAAAAAAGVGSAGSAAAAAADPRAHTESVGSALRLETLSAPVAGEEVRFYAAGSLNPNGTATVGGPAAPVGTTSNFSGARGAFPQGPVGTNYLSVSVDVPVGSRLTNIEWVIEGNPQRGRITLIRWIPDSVTAFTNLFSLVIPGAPTGITVYSAPLSEVVTGNNTYEAFYTDNGTAILPGAGSSMCNGIRVRYVPPSNGVVPITPTRVYDSRFNMAPDANGPISNGANRTVSIANSRDVSTGAISGPAVPQNATAIAYTLTIADTVGQGFLAVNPGGVSTVSASTINWFGPGQLLANTGIVQLGPNRTVTVVGGGTTNFIIDVVGYYI